MHTAQPVLHVLVGAHVDLADSARDDDDVRRGHVVQSILGEQDERSFVGPLGSDLGCDETDVGIR